MTTLSRLTHTSALSLSPTHHNLCASMIVRLTFETTNYFPRCCAAPLCGISVLEDEHIDALIKTLEDFPRSDDAAAAFFFHEHVTAVLKSKDGYEFVDSLPHAPVGMGVRILCRNAAEIKVCLQWYCLSKFSPNNQAYIDRNAWNEDRAEVDPRIFQAYVWHQPQ